MSPLRQWLEGRTLGGNPGTLEVIQINPRTEQGSTSNPCPMLEFGDLLDINVIPKVDLNLGHWSTGEKEVVRVWALAQVKRFTE